MERDSAASLTGWNRLACLLWSPVTFEHLRSTPLLRELVDFIVKNYRRLDCHGHEVVRAGNWDIFVRLVYRCFTGCWSRCRRSGSQVWIGVSVRHGYIPCLTFALCPRDETRTVRLFPPSRNNPIDSLIAWTTNSSDCSPEQRMPLLTSGAFVASQAMKSSCADILAADKYVDYRCLRQVNVPRATLIVSSSNLRRLWSEVPATSLLYRVEWGKMTYGSRWRTALISICLQ